MKKNGRSQWEKVLRGSYHQSGDGKLTKRECYIYLHLLQIPLLTAESVGMLV